MPVSFVLRVVYLFLKALVLSSFNTFFSKTKILNRHLLRFSNPAIVVSNHPNTLQDPLNVAARVKKTVFFLANASLFRSSLLNKFFSTLYCIPVERPKDVQGRQIRNDDNFAKCHHFLASGGCLFIAPEGVSNSSRRLNKVKTGTARIALGAERKKDFLLGLTIIPVGLNYTAPTRFRSSVLMRVGDPIKVAAYQSVYQQDAREAVRQLSADLAESMRALILHTTDEEEDRLLAALEEVLQNDAPRGLEQAHFRSQQLLSALQKLRRERQDVWKALQETSREYFKRLAKHCISDARIGESPAKRSVWAMIGKGLLLLLLLPVFLYALLNHLLANFIPALLVRLLNLYVGYTATVKILGGLLAYPIFYGLQIYWVHRYFQQPQLTIFYILSLLLTAVIYFWYKEQWQQWLERLRLRAIRGDHKARLHQLRGQLAEALKSLGASHSETPN